MGKVGFRLQVPEEDPSLMLVVCATAELNIVHRRRATGRVWRDVMELQERRFAAPAGASDERAPSLIPLAHAPPDSRRYVASSAMTVLAARARR